MSHETFQTRGSVALLVDGENFHASNAAELAKATAGLGPVRFRRVYGNAEQIKSWDDHGYRMCPTRPGKNSADMLLCVQAMALVMRDGVSTILIASSDRDFTYLAEELRELGVEVIGVGLAIAAKSFQNSCAAYVVVEPREPVAGKPAKLAAPPPKPKQVPTLSDLVVSLLKGMGKGAEMEIAALNHKMRGLHQTNISGQPEKTWRAFLVARPNVFVCDPRGPGAKVRLR